MYNSGHCHPITLFRLQKKVAAQKKRLELKNSNALIVVVASAQGFLSSRVTIFRFQALNWPEIVINVNRECRLNLGRMRNVTGVSRDYERRRPWSV